MSFQEYEDDLTAKSKKWNWQPYELNKVSKDPYSLGYVGYSSLRCIGYPIQLVKDAGDSSDSDLSSYIQIIVEPLEIYHKIRPIYKEALFYDSICLLECVDRGQAYLIKHLVEGDIDYFYRRFEQRTKGKMLLNPRMKPVIDRCFIQAYERQKEKVKKESISLLDDYYIHRDIYNLYEQLKQRGVKPIDPENVRLIFMQVIEDILEKHPELSSTE